MFKTFRFYPRHLVILIIRFYQRNLSFDHSSLKALYPRGFCRFNPSCSEYSIQAIEKYGIFKGGAIACWRVLRCNPFNKGGNDPLI
ncbi:MAG: membrane protein insertion efficiency factor YidD [Patescibacteria group bacterium]